MNPRERQELQDIERELEGSDPALASHLRDLTPVRRWPSLRRMLLLGTAVAMLTGVFAVVLSHVTVGLVGVTAAVLTACTYLVVLLRDRFYRAPEP